MASTHGTVAGPQATRTATHDTHDYEEVPGYGWVMFAGIMIMIAGTMNLLYGIAAIANSSFYVANTHFVFGELKTWGWIVTLIGAIQIVVGIGVWMKAQWARWTGVFIASLNGIAQLAFIPAYPWLSLAIFSLDMLVIYGLVAHGRRLEEA
ncbi:MAG: hypothetical protein WBQ21_03290 [Solirubrobacteraceae bacterium]